MDDDMQIIKNSPFVKSLDVANEFCWSFEVKDPNSGEAVSTLIHPLVVFDSLCGRCDREVVHYFRLAED